MKEEMLCIVDEEDNVIGNATYQDVIKNRLLSRGAGVMVFNSRGEIFVHKRSRNLPLYPSCYDVKFGGSLNYGETYEECALRELREESAITNVKLKFLSHSKFSAKELQSYRTIYTCTYDGELNLDEHEIEEGRFMSIDEIKKLIAQGKFSPSGREVFEDYLIKKCQRKN